MDIIVCIKQVPGSMDVKLDPKGNIIREGIPTVINPEDKNAIEEAVKLKEKDKSKITVITMGPPQAEEALREALALGCDNAVLLCDKKFAGSDTWGTANVLAAAVKKIGDYDLILCGRQAIDGDTSQVPPMLAETLNIPQITYAKKITVENQKVTAERETEDSTEIIEANLPAVITCTSTINEPRYITLEGINDAFDKDLTIWSAKEINLSEDKAGLDASLTIVHETFKPAAKGQGTILTGSPQSIAKQLIEKCLKQD